MKDLQKNLNKVEKDLERCNDLRKVFDRARVYYKATPEYETRRLQMARKDFNEFMVSQEFETFLRDIITKHLEHITIPIPKQFEEYVNAKENYGNEYFLKIEEAKQHRTEAEVYADLTRRDPGYSYMSESKKMTDAASKAEAEAMTLASKRYDITEEKEETSKIKKILAKLQVLRSEAMQFEDQSITPRLLKVFQKG